MCTKKYHFNNISLLKALLGFSLLLYSLDTKGARSILQQLHFCARVEMLDSIFSIPENILSMPLSKQ